MLFLGQWAVNNFGDFDCGVRAAANYDINVVVSLDILLQTLASPNPTANLAAKVLPCSQFSAVKPLCQIP